MGHTGEKLFFRIIGILGQNQRISQIRFPFRQSGQSFAFHEIEINRQGNDGGAKKNGNDNGKYCCHRRLFFQIPDIGVSRLDDFYECVIDRFVAGINLPVEIVLYPGIVRRIQAGTDSAQ